MEVEVIRFPDTDETVLWFEYLLDSSLLEKKLLQGNSGIIQ